MWSILALGAIERLIHHVIDLDAITRIQLNELQGKMLRVVMDSPQLSVDVFFDAHKVRLEPTVTRQSHHASIFEDEKRSSFARSDRNQQVSEATATLQVNNVVELLKLFLVEDVGNIPLQGDYHLLQDIQRIMQQAEPDLAAHLSPWIGPTLAHELGKIQRAPKQLKRSLESYLFFAEDALKEDTGLFAPRWQMDDLNQDTRIFNQNLDRAEAKIQQLQVQLDTLSTPHSASSQD
jgi:ubiquinone biosynthesis protein UbiJ